MQTIKNLVNSPYDIRLKGGKVERLPARGQIGPVEVDPLYLPLYRALGYFQIAEGETVVNDDNVTEETEDNETEIETLRERFKLLSGRDADGRWKIERLNEEIEALTQG